VTFIFVLIFILGRAWEEPVHHHSDLGTPILEFPLVHLRSRTVLGSGNAMVGRRLQKLFKTKDLSSGYGAAWSVLKAIHKGKKYLTSRIGNRIFNPS
jgi:hypothetical protein